MTARSSRHDILPPSPADAGAYADAAAFCLEDAWRPGLLVALHGLSGSRDQPCAYLDGFDSARIGVLAPDLRAHGETDFLGQPEDFTPAQLAADVEALVRRLDLASRRIFLLGVSLGATVALELMRRAVLDVVAAVFIRPAHKSMPAPHLRVNALIAAFLRDDPGTALDRLCASREYLEVAAVSERAAAGLRDKATKPRSAERAFRLDRGAAWTAFSPRERIWAAPASCIVGARNDPLHPVAVARDWHRRLLGSSLRVLPPRDDDPERYAALARSTVQEFLSRETWRATGAR